MWIFINSSIKKLLSNEDNYPERENIITSIVKELCNSQKTRICSHTRAVTNINYFELANKKKHMYG